MAIILTVDDDPLLQRILSFMLKRDDHIHVRADSAGQALERLREGPVDMLIVDVMMPGANGFSLLEKLRADRRYAALPVIMLTASGNGSHRLAAQEKGATAFLQKPASSRELTNTIRHALHHVSISATV